MLAQYRARPSAWGNRQLMPMMATGTGGAGSDGFKSLPFFERGNRQSAVKRRPVWTAYGVRPTEAGNSRLAWSFSVFTADCRVKNANDTAIPTVEPGREESMLGSGAA